MNYNWYLAGTMLHLMSDDNYQNTLCNRTVNGRSRDSHNDDMHRYKVCERCMKYKDQVVMKA